MLIWKKSLTYKYILYKIINYLRFALKFSGGGGGKCVRVHTCVYRWNNIGKMLIIVKACDEYMGFIILCSPFLDVLENF